MLAVGVESRSLTTRRREVTLGADGTDVAHAAVVERHHATGRIGLGDATGFGLRRGAIASTVAHDAHNCVIVGAARRGRHGAAVARLARSAAARWQCSAAACWPRCALPLAGLMSDRPAAEVAEQLRVLGAAAADALGATIEEPFMQLSFVALSVIPELRLTDGGLVDVDAFAHVPVEAA